MNHTSQLAGKYTHFVYTMYIHTRGEYPQVKDTGHCELALLQQLQQFAKHMDQFQQSAQQRNKEWTSSSWKQGFRVWDELMA